MKKINYILVVSLMVFSVIVPTVVHYDMNNNYEIKKKQEISILEDENVRFNIDECKKSNYIEIRGWALKINENILSAETKIGFYDENQNEVIIVPTVAEKRKDVNKQFKTIDFQYRNCGFYGKYNKKILKKGHSYRVIIFLNNDAKRYIKSQKRVVRER